MLLTCANVEENIFIQNQTCLNHLLHVTTNDNPQLELGNHIYLFSY